jgi:hypothetical protein
MQDLDRVHRADGGGLLDVSAAGLRVAHGQVGARVGVLGHRPAPTFIAMSYSPSSARMYPPHGSSGVVLDHLEFGHERHEVERRLADAVPLLLAVRVVGDGRRERTEVVPSSPQSWSIMTEPNRCRMLCKSLGCESGVDLGSRRRVGARPGACDRGGQGRCIDDAAERRLVDRRQRVAARAAD